MYNLVMKSNVLLTVLANKLIPDERLEAIKE